MRTSAFELRYSNHVLDEQQRTFQTELSKFFKKRWSRTAVRATQDGRIDPDLFADLREMGLLDLAVSSNADDPAQLVNLIVCAEVAGAELVTFPFAHVWAASRLLAAVAAPTLAADQSCMLPVLVLHDLATPQVIAWGAMSKVLVGMQDGRLVRVRLSAPLAAASGTCGIAFGHWRAQEDYVVETLADGAAAALHWERCVDAWRIMTAALTVGAANAAVAEAVQFACTRETRGVLIGALQAISHPLADAHIGLVVARNLARKAAWFYDHEPQAQPHLARLSLVLASRMASCAAHTAVHVHGGMGVSTESDVTLAFTRARQWPLVAGDPERLLIGIGQDALKTPGFASTASHATRAA